MTLSWTQIFGLFQLTIRDPKEGAEAVLTLPLPRGAVPIIFILSVVFVALLSGVLQLVLPIPEEAQVTGPGPFTLAVLQCAQTAVLILAIQKVGQWLGGQGNLVETTLILSWLQIMVLPIQAVVLFFTIVAPLLGGLMLFALVAYFFWLLTNFVFVLHRLATMGQAAKLIILALVAIVLAFTLLLTLFGVGSFV